MFELSQSQKELLENYLQGVLDINKVHNLTRISSFEEGMCLHIEDSLTGLPEIQDAPDGLYADLGSGGGFPGVPLAILTGRQTLLVDSVQKKMRALADLLAQLNLEKQIKTYSGRIETLSQERKGKFSVVTARALSSLPSLMELASPLLFDGARLICYKSQLPDNELEVARLLEEKLALYLYSDRSLLLSDGETQRRIIVFEKQGEPKVKLPRKLGSAQKHPYQS